MSKDKMTPFAHSSALVLVLDMAISMLSSGIAILLVRWISHPIQGFAQHLIVWMLLAGACSLVCFLIIGTHKIVIRYSSYRSIGNLAFAVLGKELLLAALLLLQVFNYVERGHEFMLLGLDLLLTLVVMILVRVLIIMMYERMQDSMEVNVHRLELMVYGTSDKSVSMVTRLEQSKHYMVNGLLSREKSDAGKIVQNKRIYYFENEEDIKRMKVNVGFKSILFARDEDAEAEQDGLVKICLRNGIHLLVAPRVEEVDFGGMSQSAIQQVTDNDFIPDGMNSFERNCKRIVDMCLAAVLLVVFSPLFLICYIALKLGDGGPAIYKQERIGRFGRPFYIYKFRSMKLDAEAAGPALYAGDDDPRLTKVGKFLRQHHLDELPQLWNVFKGDMAFIGWRPERKYYIDQIMERDPRYYYLYQIRPGVTSYATLKNGYTDSMEKMLKRLEYDLYYLRHRSWGFDIKILWQTFAGIAFGKKF